MSRAMTRQEWLAYLKKAIEEFDWDAEHSEKPVAWTDEDFSELIVSEDIAKDIGATVPLYASPPKREPLTDDEIADLWRAQIFHIVDLKLAKDFVRDIEAAHGIKGEEHGTR